MADSWTYVGDESATPTGRSFYYRSKAEGTQSFQVVNVDCLSYRDGPENVFELCLGEVDLEGLGYPVIGVERRIRSLMPA